MQAFSLFGGAELAVLLMFFGGAAIPLGVPPEKENPVMTYVAPDDCLLYASWAGMAAPNPKSKNHTEQLLAEAEVREFGAALERTLTNFLAQGAAAGGESPAPAGQLGKVAPVWIRTLITRPTAIYLTRLEPRGDVFAAEGGVLVQAGDSAALLDAALTELMTMEEQKPVEFTVGPRKFHRVAASRELPVELSWGAGNGYLMVGIGAGAIEAMSERIRAQKTPAWWTEVVQSAGIERRSSLSYVNVKKAIDTFAPLAGREVESIVTTLGLRQITTLTTVAGLDETGMVSKTRLSIDGPPRGLLAVLESEGIVASDLAHVPADSLASLQVSVEGIKILDAFVAAVSEVEPRAADQIAREMEQMEAHLGVHPRDALAALGNNWSVHAAAADGGLLGAALTAEVWDRAKLAIVEKRLIDEMSKAPGGRQPRITSTPFAGQTIRHVTFGYGTPFSPAWCLADKRLVMGLTPQSVKAVLARPAGEKSLAEVPEVAAALAGPKPPLAIAYYDSKLLFEATYPALQLMIPVMANQMRYTRQRYDGSGPPPLLDPAILPTPRTIGRHLQPSTTVLRRTAGGIEAETHQTLPVTNAGAVAPVAIAMLLPGVQALRATQYQTRSQNNLKQQMIALHNFHDVYNHFPAAYSVDADRKPLLSWRVYILPFVDQRPLFDEFHLNEPWDSEHNKKLLAKMPPVFQSPGSKAGPGKTTYLGVGGKRGILTPPAEGDWRSSHAAGVSFAAVTDGTSNTIALVEASDALAVEWTKPTEWVPDEKDPLKGLAGSRPGGFLAALCDGSVRTVALRVAPDTLRQLFDRADGNAIRPDAFDAVRPPR